LPILWDVLSVLEFQETKLYCPFHRRGQVYCSWRCCAQLLWMRLTLRDFGCKFSKVPLLCDNESATNLANNPVNHSRTKHIDIRHHLLRDHKAKGDIALSHVSTDKQLADIFTMPLDELRFCALRSELNILDSRNLA
jgi:hypothetical protein